MVKGILNRVKNCLKAEANQSGMPESQTCSTIGPLASLLGPAGRITLASLKKVYQECKREDFIEFVRNPVLAGSAFFDETPAFTQYPGDGETGKTQLVSDLDRSGILSGPGSSLPYAIYPLIKRTDAASPANIFTIGRTKNNDMNMKDMAISKTHAVIRIIKGSFFIEDCGSTNGTKLNGRRINAKPQKLGYNDVIGLGNHEFTFLFPSSLYNLLRKSKT